MQESAKFNDDLLTALRALYRTPPFDLARLLGGIVDGAALLIRRASGVACLAFPTPDTPPFRAGRSRLIDATSDGGASLFAAGPETVVWSAPLPRLDAVNLSAVACVPVRAPLHRQFSVEEDQEFLVSALLVVEIDVGGDALTANELAALDAYAELSGSALLLSQEAGLAAPHPSGRLKERAFRHVLDRWFVKARQDRRPLALGLIAFDGLSDVNREHGFEHGDRAREDAIETVLGALPPDTFLADRGGAVIAVLQPLRDASAMTALAETLVDRFSRDRPASWAKPLRLRIGLVELSDAFGDVDDFLEAGEAALHLARRNDVAVARWSADLVPPRDPGWLSSLAWTDAGSYRRILGIWRLFATLTRQADLDELIMRTLEGVMALIRADRAALWDLKATNDRASRFVVGRRTEDLARTEAPSPLVLRAARSHELEGEHGPTGLRALAIALEPRADKQYVLYLARDEGALAAGPVEMQLLRALAQEIALVLHDAHLVVQAHDERRKRERELRQQSRELRRLLRTRTGLIGNHPRMQAVMQSVRQMATSHLPVLITGDTGTGKEVVARLLHRLSGRPGPLVAVNCSAIPATLLESELFGYDKGAFTGAESRKRGRFEEAHHGTLLLDELGELPLDLQPKLLRVLQERKVRRIGGNEDIPLDFRVICATNSPLADMVASGRFRDDLFYRLRVLEIHLPPLRERGEDIVLLALYFLREACAEIGRDFLPISDAVQGVLLSSPWPGNIRQLQSVMRRVALTAPGPAVTPADLDLDVASSPPIHSIPRGGATIEGRRAPGDVSLGQAVADWFWERWAPNGRQAQPPQEVVEAFLLRTALAQANYVQARAAAILTVPPARFARRLQRLGGRDQTRSLRGHALAAQLEAWLIGRSGEAGSDRTALPIADELLAPLLRELLVFSRGNKTKMAETLGWSRPSLLKHLRRLGLVGSANN